MKINMPPFTQHEQLLQQLVDQLKDIPTYSCMEIVIVAPFLCGQQARKVVDKAEMWLLDRPF
jgi:hypothetical protein